MNNIFNFLSENKTIAIPLIAFTIGLILPNPKVRAFGKKIGTKLPEKVSKLVAEKLDALEKGLLDSSVNGNPELTDNDTIKEKIKGTKIDLGLTE